MKKNLIKEKLAFFIFSQSSLPVFSMSLGKKNVSIIKNKNNTHNIFPVHAWVCKAGLLRKMKKVSFNNV